MDEMKRITIENMAEVISDRFPNEQHIDYYGNDLVVKWALPFYIVKALVASIADSCFDNETGVYTPENKDFAVRLCVVGAYTNVDIPADPEEQYTLLYGTDLIRYVFSAINPDQLDVIMKSVDERCKDRFDARRNAMEREFELFMDGAKQLLDSVAGLFDGVSQDDMKKMIGAIGENGIDEEKIVKAVVAEQNKLRSGVSEEANDGK